ncbi:acyl-CoA carboxylase subunit epsilon [Arthrobacter dokdonensis]|uniref:acyl-CoA carboxylase subunit epsilon n=1 Tax=Arthrobacter dokdonellae TaxID=2211210 RepID=UPI000DE5A113|nr:acyl-CoA carboxylase subunit epsilon [Arthrobacter dokdonellae]
MTAQENSPAAGGPAPGTPAPEPSAAQVPLLSVTQGNPTAEELAAVTAVVLALQAHTGDAPVSPAARAWARRAQLHLPPRPGTGAWRRSGR